MNPWQDLEKSILQIKQTYSRFWQFWDEKSDKTDITEQSKSTQKIMNVAIDRINSWKHEEHRFPAKFSDV